MPDNGFAATDLDLISFLTAIPDAWMWRGVRIPAWSLLPLAVLGILSGRENLRDLERFARRHSAVLGQELGIELRRPPSDSAQGLRHIGLRPGRRSVLLQVDVVALCTALRAWTIAQILTALLAMEMRQPRLELIQCFESVRGIKASAVLPSRSWLSSEAPL